MSSLGPRIWPIVYGGSYYHISSVAASNSNVKFVKSFQNQKIFKNRFATAHDIVGKMIPYNICTKTFQAEMTLNSHIKTRVSNSVL